MKRSLLVSALAVVVATGCTSAGDSINDHWNANSVSPRMGRYLLGYDSAKDGDYKEFQWRRKMDINLTLNRYLLNWNPNNPFQPDHQDLNPPVPHPWSPAPNPWNYIHLEGLMIGLIPLAASGTWFPIPVDSLIATLDTPGGVGEFVEGFEELFSPVGIVVASFTNVWVGPPLAGVTVGFDNLVR